MTRIAGTNDFPTWLPKDPREEVAVAELAYLERQAILVVTNEQAYRLRKALIAAAEGGSKSGLGRLILDEGSNGGWLGVQLATIRPQGLVDPRLALVMSALPIVLAAYRAWRRAQVNALVISTDEAMQLTWPRGDPTSHELYIGSPAASDTYYPAANFHEDVLFERFAELRALLSRLGATRIEARATRGRTADGSLSGTAPTPGAAATATVAGGIESSQSSSRENIQELHPADPVPRDLLADGLAWFERERDWQLLADERYAGRAKSERIYLRQNNDYGLNAGFEAAIKGLPVSVKLGGQYHRHIETVWQVDVLFGPPDRVARVPPGDAAPEDS